MGARLRRAVERHPLLWIAVVAAAAVVAADGSPAAGGAAAAAIVAALFAAGKSRIATAALICASMAAALHGWRTRPQDAAMRWIEATGSRSANVVARVISEPRSTGRGWSALVELRGGALSGKVWWRGAGPPPALGATLAARGNFVPFAEPRNPGEFDGATWLYRQGAWGGFEASGAARTVDAPSPLDRASVRARAWFREAVTAGLDPESRDASVIRAMVLGDRPEDDDAVIESFRKSGTLHVFSVSGMHVAMVGGVLWLLLKAIGMPRRPSVVLILLGMLGYAWITGMKPPATRAVTMACVVLGAFLVRRRPDLLNALGFALLLTVLMDGHLIFRAGVQLSFGVVFAIGVGTRVATEGFSFIEWREPYLPQSLYGKWRAAGLEFRRKMATALGASTAASVGSLPLTLWHFCFVAPISILASPAIGFPVFVLMSLALLAAAISPLPGAAEAVNRVNGRVAGLCTWVATTFAAVPGGNFAVGRGRPAANFLLVYDPGYGGGAACLHDQGSTVLFDTASRPGFGRTVLPSLRQMALSPQSVVISHPESGHLGGTLEALDALPVRQILLPVQRARSSIFRDLLAAADERQVKTVVGTIGRTFSISPDARVEVLHVSDPLDWSALADERVMVTRLHWRGWRVLFMSDAGLRTERMLLDSGRDLGADLIVAGRHAHDASLGDDFLAAVGPRAIIASHADYPPEQRIPTGWEAACERSGIHVFHQGRTGAVTVVPRDDGTLELRGFIDGSTRVIKR